MYSTNLYIFLSNCNSTGSPGRGPQKIVWWLCLDSGMLSAIDCSKKTVQTLSGHCTIQGNWLFFKQPLTMGEKNDGI